MYFERTIIHKKTYIGKFSLKKHDLTAAGRILTAKTRNESVN